MGIYKKLKAEQQQQTTSKDSKPDFEKIANEVVAPKILALKEISDANN